MVNFAIDAPPQKNKTVTSDPAYTKNVYNKRFNTMWEEQRRWVPAWQELSRYINPTRGIFNGDYTKVGQMIDHKTLLSGHATHANRIFASGLNSGMTNKSSEWFRLSTYDLKYLELPGVREWFDDTKNLMYSVINQSNSYDTFFSTYEELGEFGTGVFVVVSDPETVIRCRSFTVGEYALSVDAKGRVNGFSREYEDTVDNIVSEFGLANCSQTVRAAYENNENRKVKVCHLIEPNENHDPQMADYTKMAYRSVYWEKSDGTPQFLAVRGFRKFVVVAPRWDVITTNMVYGYGPGWHALGSTKELQKTRQDKLITQAKVHSPPMLEDASVTGHSNYLPGGITKSNQVAPNTGARPAYQIDPRLDSFVQLLDEAKEEIDKFFFVNLFLMFMGSVEPGKITATEVAERQQEKIMMMGPALHRIDTDMLTVYLGLVFDELMENGMLPPPPPSLKEALPIKIEYTSILAQAQKALGITKIERLANFIGLIDPFAPSAKQVIDWDQSVREYGDMEGVDAKIILDQAQVDEKREEEIQKQNQMIALEAAEKGADITKKLADSPVGTGSALDGMMNAAKGQQ